ncbi:MAG: hypothetical protein QOJ95_1039, partial [Mycobacterium sp.]|nr:hypothetical protein [Mycobacterium sp.]
DAKDVGVYSAKTDGTWDIRLATSGGGGARGLNAIAVAPTTAMPAVNGERMASCMATPL